jgi:hypothetical protein
MLDRLLNYGHILKCGQRSWRTKTDLPDQEKGIKEPRSGQPPLAGFELTTHGRIWVTPEVVLTILVSQNRVSPLLEKGCLCRGRTHDGCEQLGTNRNPHAARELCRSGVFI